MEDQCNLPAVREDLFLGANFKETMEIAEYFSKSNLIPKTFQGSPANVFIALELAFRMGISPFMLMQSFYVIYGRPGIEAKLAIALAKKNGWDIVYDVETEKKKTVACTCTLTKSGVSVPGPRIDWDLVKAEGWDRKEGSKWNTIPDLMFRYRAAAWAIRLACPEVLMGVQTVEELEDITPIAVTTKSREDVDIENGTTSPDHNHYETMTALNEHAETEAGVDDNEEYVNQAFSDMAMGSNLPTDKIEEYLALAAEHLNVKTFDVKETALKDFDKFVKSFNKWLEKNK